MNILIAYQNYLRHLQDESSIERKKDKGFHASSSGSCYRKQLYAYFEYKSESIDDKKLLHVMNNLKIDEVENCLDVSALTGKNLTDLKQILQERFYGKTE